MLHTKADVLPFGPASVKKLGIVSGGAGFLTAKAIAIGCDTFITGETSHSSYHIAKEGKLNIIFAGHYATETLGLKALAKELRRKFSLDCRFISAPTGF